MSFGEVVGRVKSSKVTAFINRALSSYFFPVVTGAVALGCYYLGLDLVTILYMCICGTAIMICCEDVSPVMCVFLFMNVMVSMQHSPLKTVGSDFYSRPGVLAVAIIGASFFIGAMLFRFVCGIVTHRFKITPVFWGIVAFGVGLTLNGLFYQHYRIMNALYALGVSAIILLVYVMMSGNSRLDEKSCTKIAYYFIALFTVEVLELIIAYATYEGFIVDGHVQDRSLLYFGWGTYNQMGMALTMTVPAWFYLAGRYKYGCAFLIGAIANVAATFVSLSRQAILMSAVLCVICCVWYIIKCKGKMRIINGSIIGAVVLAAVIALCVKHDDVVRFFLSINESKDSGRIELWKEGYKNFLSKPVFGVGFYDPAAMPEQPGYFGENLSQSVPRMCHNTIFQLMSAGGAVALVTYVIHRVQTAVSLFKNFTHERIAVALITCGMLLTSLLDNHIFGMLPTLIYAALIGLLGASEKKARQEVPSEKAEEAERCAGQLQTAEEKNGD